jgi:hypothetical protein
MRRGADVDSVVIGGFVSGSAHGQGRGHIGETFAVQSHMDRPPDAILPPIRHPLPSPMMEKVKSNGEETVRSHA